MKSFTRNEIIVTTLIFLIVGAITGRGMVMSLLRARDSQRMSDLGAVSDALEKFHEEYGFFPPAEDGKIKACKGDNFDEVLQKLKVLPQFNRDMFLSGLRGCTWGIDPFENVATDNSYMKTLPRDPQTQKGLAYVYISNGNRFQILAHLEEESDSDIYDAKLAARAIACGSMTCNVGKAYANTPLDTSIEEYEQSLLKNTGGK